MRLDDVVQRVRSLGKEGKLDKLVYKPDDDRLPWADWCWVNGAFAIVALAIVITRAALHAAETKQGVQPDEVLHMLALLVAVGVFFLLAKILRPRAERLRNQLLTKGIVTHAAIVQANPAYGSEESPAWLPGTIVWSTDARVRDEPDLLRQIAANVAELKDVDRRQLDEPRGQLAWDLYHEMGPTPALPVPAELAANMTNTWMGTAMLPREAVPADGVLAALVLPGRAEPFAHVVLDRRILGAD